MQRARQPQPARVMCNAPLSAMPERNIHRPIRPHCGAALAPSSLGHSVTTNEAVKLPKCAQSGRPGGARLTYTHTPPVAKAGGGGRTPRGPGKVLGGCSGAFPVVVKTFLSSEKKQLAPAFIARIPSLTRVSAVSRLSVSRCTSQRRGEKRGSCHSGADQPGLRVAVSASGVQVTVMYPPCASMPGWV